MPEARDQSQTAAGTAATDLVDASDNCFALRQAARFVTQSYERDLAPNGVTPSQFSLLMMLNEFPGLTAYTISKSMVLERSATERLLKVLTIRGLVAFEVDARQRGRRAAFLTREGQKKFEQALSGWEVAQKSFISIFGAQRAHNLRKMLLDITRDERNDNLG